MSEVHAAAARIKANREQPEYLMSDARKLAEWALPLLDETRLTDSMLLTLGFEEIGSKEWPIHRSPPSMNGGPVCHIFVDTLMGCDGWTIGYKPNNDDSMIPPPLTVGQLRMLCRSLGIELKEPTN